jgi:uncharacterized protein (TIGR03118 family)
MNARAIVACGFAMAVGLIACGCGGGGSYGGGGSGAAGPYSSTYSVTTLVSDSGNAGRTDARLLDPWDIAFNGGSAAWITNHGSSTSTVFDNHDLAAAPLVIAVPPQPTGVVFNSGNGFEVSQDGRRGVARFIVASEGGTLSGWAPSLGLEATVVGFDGSARGARFTGLASTTREDGTVLLLAADFHNAIVDGFRDDFTQLAGTGRFVDTDLPAGFAPFAVMAHAQVIYVAYARQDAQARAPLAGAGAGVVNAFDSSGRLLHRLVSVGAALNAPASMAVAPAGFGDFSGALLVANAGDGTIAAFDIATGRMLGTLRLPNGSALAIDGLHRIAFGNGAAGSPTASLFFAAGPSAGSRGTYGRIDVR